MPQSAGDVTLVLEGESPLEISTRRPTLEVWSGEARLAHASRLAGDFVVRLGVRALARRPAADVAHSRPTQTFVPADRGGSADRRRLGLRLFDGGAQPA